MTAVAHPRVVGGVVAAAMLAAAELGILPGGADVLTRTISELRALFRAARCRRSPADGKSALRWRLDQTQRPHSEMRPERGSSEFLACLRGRIRLWKPA